ncbi:MAG: thioredoxin domain-containing protein, partial [Myxococcales bacterium]|nr:thioredoxin domain-containing protein [Myxococcales bacterium]
LYDNAQLVVAYLEGYQATGFHRYADLVRDVLAYVARDMTHPEGGFYSAQDADSEGVEGKFYVWDDSEIRHLLGPKLAPAFRATYNITPQGNFEGENNPWMTRSKEDVAADLGLDVEELERRLAEGRRILFEARRKRIPPLLDDKVLTAWNGLMIGAYARAHDILGDDAYLTAATRAAEFIERTLVDADGTHLLRRWREGEARYAGYLNDYAFYTQGLLDLFEASGDPRWLRRAAQLMEILLAEYADPNGGFFSTGGRNEALLVRSKDAYDGALPSGNSVSVLNLIRLADITGRARYLEEAERALLAFRMHLEKLPDGFPMMLSGVDALLDNRVQIVIAGEPGAPDTRAMRAAVWRNYLPNKVVVLARPDLADLAPLVKDRVPTEGRATAYVCHRFTCQMPTTDIDTMLQQMGA